MESSDLFEMIEDLVDKAGLLLVDMTEKNIGRSHMIRLLVDRPGRINIAECAKLSRMIKDSIEANMLLMNYRLEVSSPGIGRLLSTEVDWVRSIGRKLSVKMVDGNFIDWLEEYSNGCLKFRKDRIVTADDIVSAVEVLE
ncbi:MAG: hypothetical protein KAQ97_05150 [Candidatus Fermentibacteraceae bacterium]|nr:hypothetical protein [Candidatus Fermentibacteraceae bacterium]